MVREVEEGEGELEILRAEYKRALEYPLFDEPNKYTILLDLILDRIEILEGGR
jgi:hypothetical protein